jgi:FAD:protein FMN transferase
MPIAARPLVATLVAVGIVGCGTPPPERRTSEFRGPTMGTTWSVKVVPPGGPIDGPSRARLDKALRDDLARVNALMSTWDPESELSRLNRSDSTDAVPVSAETFEVLRLSAEFSVETGGAFDITLAPLIDAWGFGASGDEVATPEDARLRELRDLVGMSLLELDASARTVRKREPGVRCDVAAVAPGYAADRLAAIVRNHGYDNFLVDVGGELVAEGVNETGQPWQVAIERPQTRGRSIERIISVRNRAVATSGDYRKYHVVNGELLAHVIDPRTGRPIRHRLASATVIDERAVRADALATALMVLGPDEGLALAGRLDVAALFLVRLPDGTFDERTSEAFDREMAP